MNKEIQVKVVSCSDIGAVITSLIDLAHQGKIKLNVDHDILVLLKAMTIASGEYGFMITVEEMALFNALRQLGVNDPERFLEDLAERYDDLYRQYYSGEDKRTGRPYKWYRFNVNLVPLVRPLCPDLD